MSINIGKAIRATLLISSMVSVTLLSTGVQADTGTCGGQIITLPFTDVMGNPFFCSIAEAYFSALTNGTTPTTYGGPSTFPHGACSDGLNFWVTLAGTDKLARF